MTSQICTPSGPTTKHTVPQGVQALDLARPVFLKSTPLFPRVSTPTGGSSKHTTPEGVSSHAIWPIYLNTLRLMAHAMRPFATRRSVGRLLVRANLSFYLLLSKCRRRALHRARLCCVMCAFCCLGASSVK